MADLKLSVDVSDVQKALTATQRYERQINQLAQRYARGQVSSAAYNRGLLQIKRSYEQLGMSSQKATSEVRRYAQQQLQAARDIQQAAAAQRNFAAATQGAAGSINRSGVITQQAGYQIGDFIVQVQSGTNAFVAFGQQATQVAGTLTLLGGKWVLLGSALGIAIPLLTAIGAAFMRTRGQGQTLDQTVSKLKESFSELSENMGLVDDVELDLRFGNLTTEVRNLAGAMVELNAASALGNLTSVLDNLEGQATAGFGRQMLQGLRSIATLGMDIRGPEQVNEEYFARLGLSMGRQDFLGQVGQMQGAAGAGDREGVVRIFEGMVAQIREAEGGMAAVSQEGRNLVAQVYQAALAIAETNALLNGTAAEAARAAEQAERDREAREEQLEIAREITEEQNQRNQSLVQSIRELENQNRVSLLTLRYGEDSVEVQRELNRQSRARIVSEMLAAGHSAESVANYLTLVRESQDFEGQLNSSTNSAEGLASALRDAASAMQSLVGFSANLDRALAVAEARVGALRAGVNATVVGQIAGMRVDLERRMQGAVNAGVDRSIVERTFGGERDRISRLATLEEERVSLQERGRSGGGGGGTPDFASRVFGPELQAAIEQAQEDLRLYNQEVQMLDSALRAGLLTQQEYNSFVSQAQEVYNQAQQGAYDYAEALEQVEKTAMSSMENAFMSIIDGSKSASEAFRDMARQILAEAMRMMVIRPLIQGLFGGGGGGGFLGGAFGGVTGGKASGGTMMAGEPYLVGERGPELVMPSRSGTVINADLTRRAMGGSDGVSVVNNINVSGGTDPAAIRQEVAKLMPQITNATKTAVIDARRRGGQMRATFQ